MRCAACAFLLVNLVVVPALADVSDSDARTLTQLITVAAARGERAEVVSAEDLRNLVQLEADKVSAGCTDDSSCLAEVAGALGARLVIFGQLGRLDDELVLTLSLFDAEAARATGRELVRGASLSALGDQVDVVVPRMIGRALGEGDGAAFGGERPKVLVMDLRLVREERPPPVEQASVEGGPDLVVVGGVTAGVGVTAMALGGLALLPAWLAHEEASRATTPQTKAVEKISERDLWTAGVYVLGATGTVVLLVGAGVAAAGVVGGE